MTFRTRQMVSLPSAWRLELGKLTFSVSEGSVKKTYILALPWNHFAHIKTFPRYSHSSFALWCMDTCTFRLLFYLFVQLLLDRIETKRLLSKFTSLRQWGQWSLQLRWQFRPWEEGRLCSLPGMVGRTDSHVSMLCMVTQRWWSEVCKDAARTLDLDFHSKHRISLTTVHEFCAGPLLPPFDGGRGMTEGLSKGVCSTLAF